MSSLMRSHSQIEVQEKYLLVVNTPNSAVGPPFPRFLFGAAGSSITMIPSSRATSAVIGSVITLDQIEEILGTDPLTSLVGTSYLGYLFKDLGRGFIVYDPLTGNHIAQYRQCQLVRSANTEGVHGAAPDYESTYYVRTWEAQNNGRIAVSRTG